MFGHARPRMFFVAGRIHRRAVSDLSDMRADGLREGGSLESIHDDLQAWEHLGHSISELLGEKRVDERIERAAAEPEDWDGEGHE
jgi:hypothetical protein